MIPDEAVEAAWEQARADSDGYPYPEREEVRRMLEAAAPHLQSAAWQRGVEGGYHHRPNPYKEQV